jgi:hypothetical protein
MDFTLDYEQQRRFTHLIQQHRKQAGLAQWKVAEDIKVAGDVRSEISRFEKAHLNVVARWLTEPYLSSVAAAYGFAAPTALLDLFEQARRGVLAPAPDPWHPAFPGASRAEVEVERAYAYFSDALWLLPAKRGAPGVVAMELPGDTRRLAVVVDATSGVETVKRQIQKAWAATHPEAEPLDLVVTDSATLRRLPAPAIQVEDWTVDLLVALVRRLQELGQLASHQIARVERMLATAPGRSVSGLPISLIIDAIAAEARADGPVGNLHRRLVAAAWERGLRAGGGAAFGVADLGLYTDFWAELAVSSGTADWSDIAEASATAAAARVLDERGWRAPDGAELAERVRGAADVHSLPKRRAQLDEVALELVRPGASRLVELFLRMGLLERREGRLQAANQAVAQLAAAWGLAERPERLGPHPAVLCLPSAGRLFADIAVFGGDPGAVQRAIASAPEWAASDRDHAWIRFAAATADVRGVVDTGLVEAWARVVYERSGPGRWMERIWANGPAVRDLDLALITVSERFRAQLPVLATLDDLIALVPESERARIDSEVIHPIGQDPPRPWRSFSTMMHAAPWQCPCLTVTDLDSPLEPGHFRPWLWPLPDAREVVASAALNGFAPAQAALAGAGEPDSVFYRLPDAARLVGVCRGDADETARARAREEVLCLLCAGGVDLDALHRPIRLTEEALPVLHQALGLDRAPMTLWEVAVSILRRTGGLPARSGALQVYQLSDSVRVKLADALDDVAELTAVEGRIDQELRAGRVASWAGTVTAFDATLLSRAPRYPVRPEPPPGDPIRQLTTALADADAAGHEAAVALFRRGVQGPLRRRANGELPELPDATARSWLDAWRLADLWDAPLERLIAALPGGDAGVLLGAVPGDVWGRGFGDRASGEAKTLERLGIRRPDLTALAAAYSRLRFCRASSHRREDLHELPLPLDDRLAQLCDGIGEGAPPDLDLELFGEERARRALRALALAGDEAVFRAWSDTYRRERREMRATDERVIRMPPMEPDPLDPADPAAQPPAEPVRSAFRRPTAEEIRRANVRTAVGDVLASSAPLRARAWRFADEPDAADQLLTWALDAGAPYPTWVLHAVDRQAASGTGWPHWRDLPAFRRQRLTWLRSRDPGEAAGLVCISFAEISKDGPDEVVSEAADVVLDWVAGTTEPFRAVRRLAFERLSEQPPADSGTDASNAPHQDQGPDWAMLRRFFELALHDQRCDRARLVAAIERLWDIIIAAPVTHDMSLIEGEPVHLQVHEGSPRDVFDDVGRLLLHADAPGRIERLLREGVPPRDDDDPEIFESAISLGVLPMLAGLPDGTRKPRTRSEILQMRVLARFPPANLDPRWLRNAGDLFEEWAWSRLAARGDTEAFERTVPRLDEIDLTDPRWLRHEPTLSALIQHRREDVVAWLLAQARRSPEHAVEARAIVVGWLNAWGDLSADLSSWARGGPDPQWPHVSGPATHP